jgi:hypothetical protein
LPTVDLLAITAPLHVVNGTARENGAVPGVLALPAPAKAARGRERDFLFAHLALSGPPEETAALLDDLTAGLGRRFFAASGSVTAALRRAVLETNDQLLRHNLSIRRPHEGALTCAVLHGDELYTLQAGEGLAFLGHNFGIERLPVAPPRNVMPLGRSAGLDIRFAYHRLQSGDMMLLADPRLAYLTGAALAPALVNSEIESGLEALTGILANDTARLLLVEFADELPSTLPVTFQHSKKPAPSAPSKPATAPRPAPPDSPTTAPGLPGGAPLREGMTPAPRPALPHPAAPVAVTTLETTPVARIDAEPADATAPLEIGARRVASTSARGLSRLTAWLAAVLGRLRGAPPTPTAEPAIHWALPAMIAVVVPVLVAAVVTSVYLQRGGNEQVAGIKQQMVQEMLLAESAAGGAAEARGHYETVLLLSTEAEALRPGDIEVARMRADAREALDRIDGVTRMTAEQFYAYDEGVNLTGIALGPTEGGVAVLDSAGNRVLLHPTDDAFRELTTEEPTTIAFNGQSVGTEVVGPIVDLLWLPGSAAETRDSVTMLDRTGVLFSYYSNLGDIRGIRLGNSSAWLDPLAMATYLDRLYVLDSGAGQIWKYFADQNYAQDEGDPAIFFSAQAGLDAAVDFDLYSEDGSLVVIYADGRVRYYDTRSGRVQWDENTLQQSGLTTPLVAPVAVKMVGRGLNASIFILDPGSSRLVQLSRGGTVLTQYRVLDQTGDEVLSRASDFAVSDAPQRIFIAAGNRIYAAQR